MIEVAV